MVGAHFGLDLGQARTPGGGMTGFGDMLDERLLRERIIWLEGEVRDENSNRIAKQLQVLAAEDPDRDITLYINSPGGSITAGMVIYDTMQLIPNDITTVAMGLAASMGQFLLCAGTAGKRYRSSPAEMESQCKALAAACGGAWMTREQICANLRASS